MMSNNCQILGMYDEMSVMYGTVVKLENVFKKIKFAHKDMVVYHFDDDAQAAFITAHDNL